MALLSNNFRYLTLEIVRFYIPVVLTFLTAFFFSNSFSTEALFEFYANSKIHEYLLREILATLGAITALLGFLLIIRTFSGFAALDHLIDLILYEIPKNIYLFGGVLTGAMYAFSFYVWLYEVALNRTPFQFFVLGTFFGMLFFLYAFGAQYLLDRKKRRDIQF